MTGSQMSPPPALAQLQLSITLLQLAFMGRGQVLALCDDPHHLDFVVISRHSSISDLLAIRGWY